MLVSLLLPPGCDPVLPQASTSSSILLCLLPDGVVESFLDGSVDGVAGGGGNMDSTRVLSRLLVQVVSGAMLQDTQHGHGHLPLDSRPSRCRIEHFGLPDEEDWAIEPGSLTLSWGIFLLHL